MLFRSAKESPSGARIITLLSGEEGLVEAFAFGGGKSKLRSLASPWHAGRAWIYRDPAKGLITLSDFDVRREHHHIREALEPIGAASLASEILIATEALGGDWQDAGSLMAAFLEQLDAEAMDAVSVERALCLFCLKTVDLTGTMPDLLSCARCDAEAGSEGWALYSRRAGAFLCGRCAEDPSDADE